MAREIAAIVSALDERVDAMASRCTLCGKCVQACPMPGPAAIDVSDPAETMSGVLRLLAEPDGSNLAADGSSAAWARVCSGSGFCIEVCDEGVNPRFLLSMARRALLKSLSTTERRSGGRAQFQTMSRGVRVLSRLQLPPELLERLSPSSHPERRDPPELIFYTGCNLLKTPHIGLLCLDVLDRLQIRYETHGGPSSCCGVFPQRSGDEENALRQGGRTIAGFTATAAPLVLSWCPTCQIQFQETTIPVQVPAASPGFDLTMFPVFLAGELDRLRPHLTRPVNKRVALHEHPGTAGVTEAVIALLSAVPGVQLVDLGTERIGYTLNSLDRVPEHRNRLLAGELAAAERAEVTTLAGIYHSDHREIAGHSGQWPFEIVNYMEILGESMGLKREDSFKRLKTMADVDAILEDCMPLIAEHGLDLEEVRDVVLADMLGEQMLPRDRSEHGRYLGAG